MMATGRQVLLCRNHPVRNSDVLTDKLAAVVTISQLSRSLLPPTELLTP